VHEPAQLEHRPHVAALLLRIRAEQRFCNDLFSLAACLIQGEDFGWSDLVLPLAATLVRVALIVGFAAGLPDFQQKPTLRHVEIVDLLPGWNADHPSHKAGGQRNNWHLHDCPMPRFRPHESGELYVCGGLQLQSPSMFA
jgi:hypothetical protein